MTRKERTIKNAKRLRKIGLSYRAIEGRIFRSLGMSGPGNGTVAYRTLKAA